MKTPKKSIKKSALADPEIEQEDAFEGIGKKKPYDDEDDDFDMPLDDLDTFDSFDDDDDDSY